MEKNEKGAPLSSVVGVWQSVEFHVNSPEGWQFYDTCQPDEVLLWEFHPDGYVIQRQQADPGQVEYCRFTPATRELYLRREDTPPWMGNMDERFRVERVSDTQIWLYGLQDVAKEPDDYHFRIKAVRIA